MDRINYPATDGTELSTRSPLVIPWWALTVVYSGFVVLGLATIVFGSPTLDLTTPHGYILFWGGAVSISALGAAYGSLSPRREVLERWSAVLLVAMVSVWAVFAFVLLFTNIPASLARSPFTIVVFMVTALPLIRALPLLKRSGVRRG